MSLARTSPGVCPICGAEHTACTASTGPITMTMTPGRDAVPAEVAAVPLVAEVVQATLPPGHFTTATYRGDPKKRK